MNKMTLLLTLVSLSFLISCGAQVSGGSSTTIGNPVVAGVVKVSNTGVANAKVYLLPSDTLFSATDTIPYAITDSAGYFSFDDSLPAGAYRLSVLTSDTSLGYYSALSLVDQDTLNLIVSPVEMGSLSFAIPLIGHSAISGTPFVGDSIISVPVGMIPEVLDVGTTGEILDTVVTSTLVSQDETTVTDRIVHRLLVRSQNMSVIGTCVGVTVSRSGEVYAIASSSLLRKAPGSNPVSQNYTGRLFTSITSFGENSVYVGSTTGLILVDGTTSNDLSSDSIEALTSYGDLVYAAAAKGLYVINGTLIDTITYPTSLTGSITLVEVLNDSIVFIGTELGGFWTLHRGSSEWAHYDMASFGFNSEDVVVLARKSDTEIWLADAAGIGVWEVGGPPTITHMSSVGTLIRGAVYDTINETLYLLQQSGVLIWEEGLWNSESVFGVDGFASNATISYNNQTGEAVLGSLNGVSAIRSIWSK